MSSEPNQIEQPSFVSTDFRALFHSLIERSWLILLCLIAGGLLAGSEAARAPRIYQARSVLQVEQSVDKIVNIEQVRQEDLRLLDTLKTIEHLLQSRTLLEEVVDSLGLTTNSHFKLNGRPGDRQKVAMSLGGMVNVELRRGSRLIDVSVQHTDPVLARDVANGIFGAYMVFNSSRSLVNLEKANTNLVKQARELKDKVAASEKLLQEYKERMKSVSISENQDIVADRRKELNARVTEAGASLLKLKTDYEQIKNLGTQIDELLVIGSISSDINVSGHRRAYVDQEVQMGQLKDRYGPKHPTMIAAVTLLEERRKALSSAVLKARETVLAALESAKTTEKGLKDALADQEAEALVLDKHRIEFDRLGREVQSDKAMYDKILTRLKETEVIRDFDPNKISRVQTAETPEVPIKPNVRQLLLMGLAGGLALGVLISLGLNALDSSLKTVDQAENFLEMSVLGAIPNIGKNYLGKEQLVTVETSDSPAAESFRTLRTSLSFLGRDEDRRVFLFTSSIPSEGKTFCSLNYAASLAQQGFKTVLIDADLRKPAVERILAPSKNRRIGVTDYLTGKNVLKDVLCSTDLENFTLIPAGTTAPHPAELLSKTNFGDLIRECLLHFDRVVIDSAPIHAVSDTLLVVRHVQTVCLVVHSRNTPRRAVARTIHILQHAHAPLAGIIMNRLPRGRGSYYYDSYYSYSYYGKYAEKGVYGSKS